MRWFIPLVVLLAGCSGHTHSSVTFASVSSAGGVSTHIQGGDGLAVLIGLTVLAIGISEYERERSSTNPYSLVNESMNLNSRVSESNPRYTPEMEPHRRVSEQDCTKPLDYSLGNIRCK